MKSWLRQVQVLYPQVQVCLKYMSPSPLKQSRVQVLQSQHLQISFQEVNQLKINQNKFNIMDHTVF